MLTVELALESGPKLSFLLIHRERAKLCKHFLMLRIRFVSFIREKTREYITNDIHVVQRPSEEVSVEKEQRFLVMPIVGTKNHTRGA